MSNPIEEQARAIMADNNADNEEAVKPDRAQGTWMSFGPPPPYANMDVEMLVELLHAQSRFMSAQTSYIHSQELQAIATAQEQYIADLTRVLNKIGIL